MRIRPTGYELLSTARAVLRVNVLPHIPSDERQTVCAIGRAMAIAAHELEFEQCARREDVEALENARSVLREKLLIRLPKERQYSARLIAKAIAIATIELVNGDAYERAELTRLSALLHETPRSDSDTDPGNLSRQLGSLSARLSAQIRGGQFDPGSPGYAAAYAHLRESTRHALSESHPAYLAAQREPPRVQHAASTS